MDDPPRLHHDHPAGTTPSPARPGYDRVVFVSGEWLDVRRVVDRVDQGSDCLVVGAEASGGFARIRLSRSGPTHSYAAQQVVVVSEADDALALPADEDVVRALEAEQLRHDEQAADRLDQEQLQTAMERVLGGPVEMDDPPASDPPAG